jgi:pimeloyl-ACP methyl ester carboxylesterase
MPSAEVNGIGIYYEVHGKGEPLVIIGGLANDLSETDFITKALAERYRILTFDNRGAGRSDKPDEPYSIEQMAGDTAGVMKAAKFDRANVLGISMGGRIALELTLQHPEMVNKLVLASTAARTVPNPRNSLLMNVFPKLPLFKGKYPQPYYAFKRQREASRSYDCMNRLRDIHAPTLILHGKNDKTTPLALAEETHAGIKGSQMHTFKGGHLFFLIKQRQQFLDKVKGFLG